MQIIYMSHGWEHDDVYSIEHDEATKIMFINDFINMEKCL